MVYHKTFEGIKTWKVSFSMYFQLAADALF